MTFGSSYLQASTGMSSPGKVKQASESMSFLLQASTGMSSLRWQVGKGMGSIPDEADHIRFILLEPPPIDSMLTHLPALE